MFKHRSIVLVLVILLIVLGLTSCFKFENPYTAVAPGKWRGVLELDPEISVPSGELKPFEFPEFQFEEVSDGELPFTFDILYTSDTSIEVVIHNASEEIRLNEVRYGKNIQTGQDTLFINFPVFDSHISAIYEDNVMEGKWVVRNRKINNKLPYEIKFAAWQGKDYRFTVLKKDPVIDLSGKWEVDFEIETETPYKAIGDFKQEGNHLTGTFLTETGDYRFLEGTIQGDKVYLSCFDGSHAFLFEAKVLEDSSLIGSFASGVHYKAMWEGKRNANAQLTEAYELTYLKEGYDAFDFAFKNEKDQLISLNDERYQGKPKLIQIMGTYCPNCRDETNFLKRYFAEHPEHSVDIIALAFEKYRDPIKAQKTIARYKEKMGIEYEVLLAGSHIKSEASEALPMLNRVFAYPTLIFLDRENNIKGIHTGFSGPATDQYESFIDTFEEKMNLLTEQ